MQVSQVGIPNMYLASGCMGNMSSPVSVLRSNSERSKETLVAEEGSFIAFIQEYRDSYLMLFQNRSDIFGKIEG